MSENLLTFFLFIAGCVAVGVAFSFRFIMYGSVPSPHDLWLAGGILFVLLFLRSLETRENRQEKHFEEIKSRLGELEKRMPK